MGDWENWTARAKAHMRGRITQDAIAEKLNVTQGQVGHWLNKRRKINLDEFFAFCKAIGADPGEILFGTASPADIKQIVQDEVAAALSAHPEINPRYLALSGKLGALEKAPAKKNGSNARRGSAQ